MNKIEARDGARDIEDQILLTNSLKTPSHASQLADLYDVIEPFAFQRGEETGQEDQSENCVLLVDDCPFNLAAI